MILNSKDVTVAYRCPECGDTVFSLVGIFSLSGDMVRLICKNCRSSVLTINPSDDGKVRLSVPCIACPKPHNYTLTKSALFKESEDALSLPCPYTGIDVCFIGTKESVKKSVEKSDEELIKLMNEAGISSLEDIRGDKDDYENEDYDPIVEDIISYVISDLDADNAIHCNCKEGEGSYSYRLDSDRLIVFCENCKTAREIRMTGIEDAHKFLETSELDLK